MIFVKSRTCHQTDGKQGAFSGHARGRQSQVDSTKLAADSPTCLRAQD